MVLAPTTVKPTPGPRDDTDQRRTRAGDFLERPALHFRDQRARPARRGGAGRVHDGKPIGVQLIAGRYREDLALDAAAAIEKRAGMLVRQLWDRMG